MVLPSEVTVEITGMVVIGSRDEEELIVSDEEPACPEDAPAEKSAMAVRAVPEADACADWQYCRPYW